MELVVGFLCLHFLLDLAFIVLLFNFHYNEILFAYEKKRQWTLRFYDCHLCLWSLTLWDLYYVVFVILKWR